MQRKSIYQKNRFKNLKDKKIRIIAVSGGIGNIVYKDLCGLIWANYRSLSGSEYYFNSQQGAKTQAVFTVNWRTGIKESMYILFGDKLYRIAYIDDLEGYKSDIKLHCETDSAMNLNEKKAIIKALGL